MKKKKKPGPKIGPEGKRINLTFTIAEDLHAPLVDLAIRYKMSCSRAVECMIRKWVEAEKARQQKPPEPTS